MFDLFKPRTTAEALGSKFADHAVTFWVIPNLQCDDRKTALVELGCNEERTPIELIALQIFAEFYGMTAALSHKYLPDNLYPRMTASFISRVAFLTRDEMLPFSVTVAYETLEQLITARMEHYGILLSTTQASEIPQKTIEYCCDFIHDGTPSQALKSNLHEIFNEGSSHVFTTITRTRVR